MPRTLENLKLAEDVTLGLKDNERLSRAEQLRQRREAEELCIRLRSQPGVILADEVGMGKTFVALTTAFSVAVADRRGPVVVMVPPNLLNKWQLDLFTFCNLYLDGWKLLCRQTEADERALAKPNVLRYGVATSSTEFLKLYDDKRSIRCHIVLLAQGAMSRGLKDPWVRLAMIREAFRRYSRRERLRKIRKVIHRYTGELLRAGRLQNRTRVKEGIWRDLLRSQPSEWMGLYNHYAISENDLLHDHPVPEAVVSQLPQLDLRVVADALEGMPLRASATQSSTSARIRAVRQTLRHAERTLWAEVVANARWRSPLLVLDEAHHLKNPRTSLARQLQSADSEGDMRQGDGALAKAFDRMLFLTATPFQLGHQELIRVLRRFRDVRWSRPTLGDPAEFDRRLDELESALNESLRASIRLFRKWQKLSLGAMQSSESFSSEQWWNDIRALNGIHANDHRQELVSAFNQAEEAQRSAQQQLRPFVIRHNNPSRWPKTGIPRRCRQDGDRIRDPSSDGGIGIPNEQMFPFYLAARGAANPGRDILGEALCSSYEAFRETRRNRHAAKDRLDSEELDLGTAEVDGTLSNWYIGEFDRALKKSCAREHPKIAATVQRAVDLWVHGEKVLVFAFYRQTCRALRMHISNEINRRVFTHARRRLAQVTGYKSDAEIKQLIGKIQDRYFHQNSPGRVALDRALLRIVEGHQDYVKLEDAQPERLVEVMRRFLRVPTTLVRAFPITNFQQKKPSHVVQSMLGSQDGSKLSWRDKFVYFLDFLSKHCSPEEREQYISAAGKINTRHNVRVATGETSREARARLMKAFNTPFFPDILVSSQIMGEGVDLHRYCRFVIHHDLDWNPSSIEQRTGRVDRIGCKASISEESIEVNVPYLAGTADERQYRVMTDRESWFRVVMGQDTVSKLIPPDTQSEAPPPPRHFGESLAFDLSCVK